MSSKDFYNRRDITGDRCMTDNDLVDRETYRAIKKMNREQFSEYLLVFSKNVLANQMIDEEVLTNIRNEISSLKGIGEKRTEEIMNKIKKHI